MSKTLTLNLGGKERVCNFGKFWFNKFYGQVTGKDPINSTDFLLNPEQQFDFVCALIYAGLKTTYKVEKMTVDFTKDDVDDWVGNLEDNEVAKIIEDYTELNKKPGETMPHQNGQLLGMS